MLHLSADDGVAVSTVDAERVVRWDDLSGYGNSLSPVPVPFYKDSRPKLHTGALNGHNYVEFDGVDDGLLRNGLNALPMGTAERTAFLVTSYKSAGWGGLSYGEIRCFGSWGPTVSSGGNLFIENYCSIDPVQSGVAGTGQGWIIQAVVLKDGRFQHYKGDDIIQDKVAAWSDDIASIPNRIMMGQEISGVSKVKMDVAEALVYNRALTELERIHTLQALSVKYGLNIKLSQQSAALMLP